ncbi:MAG: signal peptidase II [Hyphomicrobiales bacterium]
MTSLAKAGFWLALVTFAIDQAHKWIMLGPVDIANTQPIRVAPFLDLMLAWNKGVSYGWFSQDTDLGRWLLIALAIAVTIFLCVWLMRATTRFSAFGLGLLIGGALSNALDRVVHGAVADFFAFHAYGYNWYVFNLADVAIVAGVVALLYDSIVDGTRS